MAAVTPGPLRVPVSPAVMTLAVLAMLAVLSAVAPTPALAVVTTRAAIELNLLVGYSEDLGWVGMLPGSQRSAVGFEHFAKFSTERGDVVTTDLQVRASYDSRASSDEAWVFEVHNAWLEYRLGLGKKLRFGHFSPAHGLEPIRDTHGTLTQTLAGMDLGFKKDWGIGYSGIAGPFDLQAALQLGSGMAPAPDNGSYLASAQIWTPPGRDSRFGLSMARGDLRTAQQPGTFPLPDYAEGTVGISRVGLAAEHTAGPFTLLAEVTAGANDSSPVGGVMLELDYTPPSNQRLTFESQLRAWDSDLDRGGVDVVTGLAGISWRVTDALTTRAAVTASDRAGGAGDMRAVLQLYYYGG